MSNEMHWGGINGKGLLKAVLPNIWMVFAVMVITYLGLSIIGNMRYTPSYTSSVVVAVYPYNRMYTLEASSDALATVGAVNEVFNSEMFRTGLNESLTEPADYSLYSRQIDGTCILMLSVTGFSPEDAYRILRDALDYFGEISPHLVGESHLEILTGPDFPSSASNSSGILRRRPLLTLLMGVVMGSILVLMYAVRRTYKTTSAIRRNYQNVRFFMVQASDSDEHGGKYRKESRSVSSRESVRKTALELQQILWAKNINSIFVTSAAHGEGKTEITVSLARELARSGRSVIILFTDPESSEIPDHLGIPDNQPRYAISDLLQNGVNLESIAAEMTDLNIKVIFANKVDMQDDFDPVEKDAARLLERAAGFADVILVDGCIWTGSRDEMDWKEAAGASIAVCRQDKADFYAIDRMITDLQEDDSGFLGCVLYGF